MCHKGLAAVLRNGAGVPLDADGAERRVGGTDQNGWFIGENPIYKWMITRGTGYPYFKKPPYIYIYLYFQETFIYIYIHNIYIYIIYITYMIYI